MNQANNPPKNVVWWLLATFLTVIGAQFWLVWLYGSALPYWDQWDEALKLFQPWMEGRLTAATVAAPFNDHRIILTYLLDMSFIRLNGRWDPLLQMTVNAFMHAIFATGMTYSVWRFLGRRKAWLAGLFLLPFFTFPYAGENAIWAFNSQWYLLDNTGLAAIVGLGFCRPGSWWWWAGLAAAALGLLTMALGPFIPAAIGGMLVLRVIRDRRWGRESLISMGACLGLMGAGATLLVGPKGYNFLQAHTFAEFAAALCRHLQWPFYHAPEMACVILLPLALLLIYYFRPNFQAPRMAELLLSLALWSMLQSIVIAYGRANYGDLIPSSRYTEVFSTLLIASLFATVLLGEQWQRDHFPKWNGLLLPLVYAVVIFWGLGRMSQIVVDNLLAPSRMMNLIAEERVVTFRATGNDQDLLERPTIRPRPEVALAVLRSSALQAILPVACISPAPKAGWLTPAALWLLRHGTTILEAGLVWFAGLCGFGLVRGTMDLSIKQPVGIIALLAAVTALSAVWSKHSIQRESVEFGMQQQLADYFKSEGRLGRAAYHAQAANKLKPAK